MANSDSGEERTREIQLLAGIQFNLWLDSNSQQIFYSFHP